MSDYNILQVKNDLSKKGVSFSNEKVNGIMRPVADTKAIILGIKSLGKLDYLMNYCDFIVYREINQPSKTYRRKV